MRASVEIKVKKNGVVIDQRIGHNVWVKGGKEYLAQLMTFTSPAVSTPEGNVDLVANFPKLTNQLIYLRIGHYTGQVEYKIQLASPVDSTDLLSQINSQITGVSAVLGPSNGLVFTTDNPNSVELIGGGALPLLGLIALKVAPQGMTSTPVEDRRVKYLGFGIGGVSQATHTSFNSPYIDSYPPGSDPNTTTGKEYNKKLPEAPLIRSLERPIRISGGETAYPGDPSDVWLLDAPKFFSVIYTPGSIRFHGFIDTPGGDIVYGSFTDVPLSEVGLFLSNADINDAFNVDKLVAYYSFGTILVTSAAQLDLTWTVTF